MLVRWFGLAATKERTANHIKENTKLIRDLVQQAISSLIFTFEIMYHTLLTQLSEVPIKISHSKGGDPRGLGRAIKEAGYT